MTEKSPKVSVIVPTYQSEATLTRCLDSILQQTICDIEVIVVDDGSTDKTADILIKYTKADNRIVYLRQENYGVSTARNTGLKVAKGTWVVFVDSDDWLDEDYVESLLPENEDVEFSVSGFIRHDKDQETIRNPFLSGLWSISDAADYIDRLEEGGFLNMPWSKLYSKKVIDKYGICFPPQYSYGEDKLFVFNYLCHCHNIQIKQGNSYHYIIAEQGLSARMHPMETIWSWNEDLIETYKKIGKDIGFSQTIIKNMSERTYTYFTLYMANAIYYEPYPNNQRLSLIKKIYNRRRDERLFNKKFCKGKTQNVAALLYKLNCPVLSNAIYSLVCSKQGKGMLR